MTHEENIALTSKLCLDILVGTPNFPDFSFVLYEDNWVTHHVITQRNKSVIAGRMGAGTIRENFEPSQMASPFDSNYVNLVFNLMKRRKEYEKKDYNINELALIPFAEREADILKLGNISENLVINGRINIKIINYTFNGQPRKLKIYSPPNVSYIERDK